MTSMFQSGDFEPNEGGKIMLCQRKKYALGALASAVLLAVGASGADAGIVTDQLSLYVDARAPGANPATTWAAQVGTDGDLIDLNGADPFDHTPVLTTSGGDTFYQTSFTNDVGGSQVDFGPNHMFDWDQSFTYEAYVRPQAAPLPGQAGRGAIMGNQMKNATGSILRVRDGDGDGTDYRLEFTMRDNTGTEKGLFSINTAESIAFGEWRHIVATYAGAPGTVPTLTIYLDGNVISGTQGGNIDLSAWTTEFDFINQPNNTTSIASRSTPNNTSFNSGDRMYLDGDFMFARIYGKALSTAEVQQNFQNLSYVPEPGVGLAMAMGMTCLAIRRRHAR
jgi:Concanavalin A-like lectin/glucanases superfamily